jgi:hypothetical protein
MWLADGEVVWSSGNGVATRIYRLPLFVTRNFKSSTFVRINFSNGDVLASL